MKRSLTFIIGMVLMVALSIGAFAKEIPVSNGSFEEFGEGVDPSSALGKLPYLWDATYDPAMGHSVSLTTEKVYSGKYAMKIVDNSSANGVLAISKPIPVEPGKEYMALVYIYNTADSAATLHLYMEFWSEDQWDPQDLKGWDRSKRVGVPYVASKKKGEWEEVSLVGTAPKDAKFLTITLVGGNAATLVSYVDEVRLGVKD